MKDPIESRQLHPSDSDFPFTLSVNDHSEKDEFQTGDKEATGAFGENREGWATLSFHDEDGEVCDANPYPDAYIQEQPISDNPIPPHLTAPFLTTNKPHFIRSWATPKGLLNFIEHIRDEYYEKECGNLQVNVETMIREAEHRDFDYYGEIYFRNGGGNIEYIMWSVDELYHNQEPNSELIQKVLTQVGDAYEKPSEFIERWKGHKVQIDSF